MTGLELLTAIAALIAAAGGFAGGVAAIISAVQSTRGRKAAEETRDLVRVSVAQNQRQTVHVHLGTTAGEAAAPRAIGEVTFTQPTAALPPRAIDAELDAGPDLVAVSIRPPVEE